ncbi:urea amidolyase associated protein UAAP1 [Amnibacterium flavum]|uniref:Urea carboxylase n=1 Tax=Amnibacterium flavum TaxID=2173173 RepID=A0A2V1HRX8_9MICO|nr:urea amidolyase associated protein UAAP1 [Amnibacterium flavum]PVZ95376.1 urea carboxylase [Amnibacterium flavum]
MTDAPHADSSAAPSSTADTTGAKAHARAQGGAVAESQPWLPAAVYPNADPSRAAGLVWAEVVAGGSYTSAVLARGTVVTLRDIDGDACASVLLYNASEPQERLNVADTVKVQWQVYSAAGQLLLSDQGRVLARVVADGSGQHDAVFGVSSAARNERRYGNGGVYGPSPAGRELQKLAGAKRGLGPRDISPALSFFKGVVVEEDGSPRFTGSAAAGAAVTLLIEMPVILLIANAPHPLDPRSEYACGRLEITATRGVPTSPADPEWSASPEGERAYLNTESYLLLRGDTPPATNGATR